ncbi:hypothetical protein [Planotetraspora kaengkrachanensis]|uniref:Uncharacterized protein n=1 Tax=Planotetraspora kaengkrachanensis TaxID=575193 RepID=A0A8J3PR69_9ACTN|nr:hypothetical protein [Planotetraspora kaengkrachanensis]GIG77658.1 hypothetical protein Pka01_07850 [Planotetraspora kaengkrachanensis]
MSDNASLQHGLGDLFGGGTGEDRSLSVSLPPGRIVLADEGAGVPTSWLAAWCGRYTEMDAEDDPLSPAERLAVTAPFGQEWPGLAATAHGSSESAGPNCS